MTSAIELPQRTRQASSDAVLALATAISRIASVLPAALRRATSRELPKLTAISTIAVHS